MKKMIILTTTVVLCFNLFAQNTIENILTEVVKNNTTLSAYRKTIDAEKTGNKTGLNPQNPEIEFNYLWGSPSVVGNRTDFSIRQSFDFPTAYSYKNQIASLKNEQAGLAYKKQLNTILFETRMVCVKLTYHNALLAELNKRHAHAMVVANACKTRINSGDASVIDYNKAQLYLLNILKDIESNEIERNTLLSELVTLNGGNPIKFTDSLFTTLAIPTNFEQWYTQIEANNPLLQWVKQEIAIAEMQVKLNASNSFPRFYAGYMIEKVIDQEFQGFMMGMTIPLWENKNTVKHAKSQAIAMQSAEADALMRFYNSMKATHSKLIAMQNNLKDYRSKLELYSNNALVEKAFEMGEISLSEYMFERSLNYQYMLQLLDMELELNSTFAEISVYQ
jgi:outer membrane protein TolC